MTAFVEDVAADVQVEATEVRIRLVPVRSSSGTAPVAGRSTRVGGQEFRRERRVARRQHVGAALPQHQAGQVEAATDFEDAFAVDRIVAHVRASRLLAGQRARST